MLDSLLAHAKAFFSYRASITPLPTVSRSIPLPNGIRDRGECVRG